MTENNIFQKPGTLNSPGPIGRIVRLLFGMGCLFFIIMIMTKGTAGLVGFSFPSHPGWWVGIVMGFYVFSYVINIGYTRTWGRWPQLIISLVIISFVAFYLIRWRSFWGPSLGWFILLWLAYVYGHLGISFILAGVLATPGCEMRAIPDFWARIFGHESKEHRCPSFIGQVDRWEANRHK